MKKQALMSVVVGGLFAVANPADAAQYTVSGASFQAQYETWGEQLFRSQDGITNNSNIKVIDVIGGINHMPSPNGLTVYVDAYMYTDTKMSCRVDSYNWNGAYLGSHAFDIGGYVGNHEVQITMLPVEVPVWAYITAGCSLLTGQAARLIGVTAEPY